MNGYIHLILANVNPVILPLQNPVAARLQTQLPQPYWINSYCGCPAASVHGSSDPQACYPAHKVVIRESPGRKADNPRPDS